MLLLLIADLHCCEKSESVRCGDTCRQALRTKTTHHEIVDALQDGGCGTPMHFASDKVWTCLMQSGNTASAVTRTSSGEVSRIDRTGIDGAKLHCCSLAVSTACRKYCLKTFSNEWGRTHDVFDRDCLSQPFEGRLASCITDGNSLIFFMRTFVQIRTKILIL